MAHYICNILVTVSTCSSHSALSGGTPHSQLTQHPPEDINPFEQHIVNMMLNTLGVPVGRMEKISGNFPRIISGHGIEVGGERYDSIKKLAEGGFAKVYVGKYQGQLEALKVGKKNYMYELRGREESDFQGDAVHIFIFRFKVQLLSGNWL